MSLYVKKIGSETAAKTLVFLHGLGVSSWMWNDQLEALQNEYQCLAIDLPGNGESYNSEWLSFTDTAEQVAATIRQHSSNRQVHVVGLSLGGYTALYLLQQHPELVASTVVSGVTTQAFSKQWLWKGLAKIMPIITRRDFVIKQTAKMMQLPPEAAELYSRDTKRLTKLTYKRVYGELLNFRLPASLVQSQARLLAVAGEKEMPSVKADLANFWQMPQAVTALVPNVHHGWNGEQPELFTNMVRAWVENEKLPSELQINSPNRPTEVAGV